MATQEAPPSPTEADAEEVELEIDEATWKARVLGRAGGTVPSRVPMLLLGFWPDGEVEGVDQLGHEQPVEVPQTPNPKPQTPNPKPQPAVLIKN